LALTISYKEQDMAGIAERSIEREIGESLERYQQGLKAQGRSFSADLSDRYAERWRAPTLRAALRVRTSLVAALHEFLVDRGLFNIDRVSMSPITDPLAHDVEHSPEIDYKGVSYRTTHSMIYSKMLACMNPDIPGIFVDSPNIRLELPSASGAQREKYLVDFSQMDIELRRKGRIGPEMYSGEVETVSCLLGQERDRALDFFEDLIRFAVGRVLARDHGELADLGVSLEVPPKPFPRFYKDEAARRHGEAGLETALGREAGTPFFWILGLFRENYDLVYPYLPGDARHGDAVPSARIYNYDLCASSLALGGSGGRKLGDAFEVLSGGLREWIYPVIVQRLVDNGVLPELPRFDEAGNIENMAALGGYGPFLAAARLEDESGLSFFPETFGGGLGLERFLFAVLRGPEIRRIEDVTLFGKNPDSADLYLF
jgi:hypothetical protein